MAEWMEGNGGQNAGSSIILMMPFLVAPCR